MEFAIDEATDLQRRLKEASCIRVGSISGESFFSIDNPPCVRDKETIP